MSGRFTEGKTMTDVTDKPRRVGRPTKREEDKKIRVNFSLDRATVEKLRRCQNASRTIDELVRLYIDV